MRVLPGVNTSVRGWRSHGLSLVTGWRSVGAGAAWYLGTRLDADGLQKVTDALLAEAGLTGGDAPDGVELVRRHADDGRSWLFVLNHTADEITVPASGHELLRDVAAPAAVVVPAGAVAVVRES